jgi:uncharacterized protein (TIGR00369 family)
MANVPSSGPRPTPSSSAIADGTGEHIASSPPGATLPSAALTGTDGGRLPALVAAAASTAHGMPSLQTLGGRVVHQDPPNLVRVEFPAAEAFFGPHGALSGGFVSAMIEAVIALCAQGIDARPAHVLDLSVRFFRTIRAGHVIVDATVLRAGRTTATFECLVWDDGRELCAKASATALIVG